MPKPPETLLAKTERHVAQGEQRIARQQALIEDLEREHHREAAARERTVLATMESSLRQMREHLEKDRDEAAWEVWSARLP
jgi:hypothetical protein